MGTPGFGIFTYDPRIERFHTQQASSIGWMAPLADGRSRIQTVFRKGYQLIRE